VEKSLFRNAAALHSVRAGPLRIRGIKPDHFRFYPALNGDAPARLLLK
jgi:hypothetical protein